MAMTTKTISIAIAVASIVGTAGIGWGVNKESIKTNKRDVKEIKVEIKEKRAVDIQQSLLLRETSVRLEAVGEALKELKK